MFKFVVVLCALVVSISCRSLQEHESLDLSSEEMRAADEFDRVERYALMSDGTKEEEDWMDDSDAKYDRVKRDTSSSSSSSSSSESSESCDDSDSTELGLRINGEGEGKLEFDGILKSLLGKPVHVYGQGAGYGRGIVKLGPLA